MARQKKQPNIEKDFSFIVTFTSKETGKKVTERETVKAYSKYSAKRTVERSAIYRAADDWYFTIKGDLN